MALTLRGRLKRRTPEFDLHVYAIPALRYKTKSQDVFVTISYLKRERLIIWVVTLGQ